MLSIGEILLRLALGAVFGGIIGYERQVHGRPAGFRTHMLVCVASVLIMEVSEYYHYLALQDASYVRVDPGRIAAGAITGIGFLGAGVILKMGATVQGLTTAACIWMVSAIGLALGAGIYAPSAAAFALTLFILLVLRAVERRISKDIFKTLSVMAGEAVREEEIHAVLKKRGASVYGANYEKDRETGDLEIRYTIAISDSASLRELVEELAALATVRKVVLKS